MRSDPYHPSYGAPHEDEGMNNEYIRGERIKKKGKTKGRRKKEVLRESWRARKS